MMISTQCLKQLDQKENLSKDQIRTAFMECFTLLQDESSTVEGSVMLSGLLLLLRIKGETEDELTGILEFMSSKAIPLYPVNDKHQFVKPILDIVGTGGDKANTVNISTASAILAAACGAKVIKHGSGSVSSLSGSADVLIPLGINYTNLTIEDTRQCADTVGITFCLAPMFHPVFLQTRRIRKALKIPTLLNLLGPVLNPAGAAYRLVGVSDPRLTETVCQMLKIQRCRSAFVFHGAGGLDELTPIGPSDGLLLDNDGFISQMTIDPFQLGLPKCTIADLMGSTPSANANCILDVFSQGISVGPLADTFCLNAGVGLWLVGEVTTIEEGINLARSVISSKKALNKLEEWQQFCLIKRSQNFPL